MRVPVAGLTEVLTDRDIARALNIANGSEAEPRPVSRPLPCRDRPPPVEHLEVITEFRRFVLAAEDQFTNRKLDDGAGRRPSQKGRTLKDLLAPRTGQVSIRAHLRFHPLNNY